MANKKIWIAIAALFAVLLGAAPVSAGIAMDDTVVLDPYDPVPPVQFRHWYAGYDCDYGCGHCWHSCYRHRYDGCHDGCYDRCHDGCYRRDGYRHDCDGCGRDGYPRIDLPCTTDDCYESTRWEHRFRDGDQVHDEWLDRGRNVGNEAETFRHHFSKNDYDDN